MTLEEVKAMTIGLREDGVPCLCKKTKTGKVLPVREITPEESAAVCSTLFMLFRQVHPESKVMTLPHVDGKVLAVTEIETEKEE